MYFIQNGIIDSDELALLRSVLDEHCSDRAVTDPKVRENLAARLLSVFTSGTRDRDALLQSLAVPEGT